MFKRILCPVDFDSSSLEALRAARDLAIVIPLHLWSGSAIV
jgi:hypothetical protein